ncbi:hypothetical protein SAMN06265370_12235 [Puniceibacterium sediminis]|uniref:Uncharacterized protein n=1 Tax=Puniceibacterium sediminis TaxID=1608407 RepID=A0A238Z2Y8_9RHOB|nr:hypothetical protein SAMN06265370_12235 [Puniceibacterium sediminis]
MCVFRKAHTQGQAKRAGKDQTTARPSEDPEWQRKRPFPLCPALVVKCCAIEKTAEFVSLIKKSAKILDPLQSPPLGSQQK